MIAAVMAASLMLSGCSGSNEALAGFVGGSASSASEITDIQQTVTVGKSVFVDDGGTLWFGYNNYLCSAKADGKEISDISLMARLSGDIYAIAVYDGYIYISQSDGFFRQPLSNFGSGKKGVKSEAVFDDSLASFHHFEIYGDRAFFTRGKKLCCVPLTGGEKTDVEPEVSDFEISDRGIYVLKEDGSMKIISNDLTQSRDAGTFVGDIYFTVGGTKFLCSDKGTMKVYDVTTEKTETVPTEEKLCKYDPPWSNGDKIVYSNEKYEVIFKGKSGELTLDAYHLPDKIHGYLKGDYLYSTDASYSKLRVMNVADSTVKIYDTGSQIAAYLEKLGSGGSSGSQDTGYAGSSASYDITEGYQSKAEGSLVRLYFNDFQLVMPGNDKWSYEVSDDRQSVTFYLFSANQEGYGGKLVTIRAYDAGDTSYEKIPSWQVAGTGGNTGKRFVAIYPTDLQYNSNDSTQAADYQELYAHVRKIAEGMANSPLYTSGGSSSSQNAGSDFADGTRGAA